MTMLTDFLRRLFGPSLSSIAKDLHFRMLNDWLMEPDNSFVHPQCVWKLVDGHPFAGVYTGQHFFNQYLQHIESTYPVWHEVVIEIVSSQLGGIVVGEYQFRREANGLWYKATFTHFYRIHRGKIVGVHFYMGEVSIHLQRSQQLTDLSTLFAHNSLN